MKNKQVVAKRLNQQEIEEKVKSFGPSVEEIYREQLAQLNRMYLECQNESQEHLAAFMFAHAQMGNIIAQLHNVKI